MYAIRSYYDNAALLDKILTDHPEVDFVQLQLNYLDWESSSIQSRKCYETARKHNKPIVVMEPVKGGTVITSYSIHYTKLYENGREKQAALLCLWCTI